MIPKRSVNPPARKFGCMFLKMANCAVKIQNLNDRQEKQCQRRLRREGTSIFRSALTFLSLAEIVVRGKRTTISFGDAHSVSGYGYGAVVGRLRMSYGSKRSYSLFTTA